MPCRGVIKVAAGFVWLCFEGKFQVIALVKGILTEDYDGVKDFAVGCMRTYLILKEKAEKFNQDAEIQALLKEINADDGSMDQYFGKYSAEKAASLKDAEFDRVALGKRRLPYERLDQLTIELLLGLR